MACWDGGHLRVPPLCSTWDWGFGREPRCSLSGHQNHPTRIIPPASSHWRSDAWGGAGLGEEGLGLSRRVGTASCGPPFIQWGHIPSSSHWEGLKRVGSIIPIAAWLRGIPRSSASPRVGALPGRSIPLKAQFVRRQCGEPLPLHPHLCCGWAWAPAGLHAEQGQGEGRTRRTNKAFHCHDRDRSSTWGTYKPRKAAHRAPGTRYTRPCKA